MRGTIPRERSNANVAKRDWQAECETARSMADELGEEQALAYLIGEPFLNFLEAAEHDSEFRAEIPAFVADIKGTFGRWQIEDFFTTPRQLGATGHFLDEEADAAFRAVVDPVDNLREDAQPLTLLEWATEFLLDKGP